MKPSYQLLKRAVRAHRTRYNRLQWLRAVDYLGSRWLLAAPQSPERLREQVRRAA